MVAANVLAARCGGPPAARDDMYPPKRHALPQSSWHGLFRGRA
ncbi:hypothetical protein [Actinoplanes sp. NBRC 101535]|nr:hypothetical protein [Actinoplanes sp. NBRC 101535]